MDAGTVEPMLDLALLLPEHTRPLSRRLRRPEYERLVALGVFADQRVELLRGELVEMSPQLWGHAWITAQLGMLLADATAPRRGGPRRWHIRHHSALVAGPDSVPEPDLSVAAAAIRDAHPTESALVIEVADSSLRKDRRIKTEIYAAANVPEYWIVDVNGRQIEVRREPHGRGYGSIVIARPGDVIRPVRLRGVTIAVAAVFPPRRAR